MLKYIVFLASLIFLSNKLSAEEEMKGTVAGIVMDKETKKALMGATIRVLNTNLGAIADYKGEFLINEIPIGRYQIQASFLGYETALLTDVVVVTKRYTNLTFEMKMSYVSVDEIVVSAKENANLTEISTISKTEITNQEVRNTAGVSDIFRRLQYLPGVSAAGDQSSSPIIRGGNPDENLTLIENIEVTSPYHFSSMNSEMAGSFSILDPKLIDKVNISTGGFSSQFGDKLSSVIKINLMKPNKNQYEGDIALGFSGIGGYLTGPISKDFSFLFAARRGILEYMMKMMDEKFIPTTNDFHLKCNYDISESHLISFYGLYAQDEISGSHSDEIYGDRNIYSLISKNQTTFGVNWNWLISESSYLLTTPYFNYSNWELINGPEWNKEKQGQINFEKYAGLKTEYFLRLNNLHRITLGAEYRLIFPEYSQFDGLDTTFDGKISEAYSINYNPKSSSKISSFVQYAVSPFNWFDFQTGLRADYFAFIDRIVVSPRIAMSFKLYENLSLNLSSGLFYQFPEYYRIFIADENKSLLPQKALHYVAGIETALPFGFQTKIEVFYKDYSNLAVAPNDTSKILKSTGTGYVYGTEISFSKRMTENFYMNLNYSYSVSKRRDDDRKALYNSNYDKTHQLNLICNYKISDWWELSFTVSYATGMPYTPLDLATRRYENGVWYVDKAEKNSGRYPDYFRVDARIDRRFVFQNWNLRLYFEIWNLTNHNNIFEYNYHNNFSEKKSECLFPSMPMIGIAAEL